MYVCKYTTIHMYIPIHMHIHTHVITRTWTHLPGLRPKAMTCRESSRLTFGGTRPGHEIADTYTTDAPPLILVIQP